MDGTFDIWKMLAGIAIFMLGMNFLEHALKLLSGRQFKLFLKKQTSSKLTAIAGGAVITALLQSSSVVNLMVLGFVGAGVIKTNNALAVILGTNLGTTFSTWIVATIGFKLNIESYALPVLGIAGILMLLLKPGSRLRSWSMLFLGLSLLFTGLEYMKTSVATAVQSFDLSQLNNYHIVVFLVAGLIITTIIQSSSATVAIVLSALHANVFSLYAATAVVLGSEVGTTIKLIMASAGDSPIKKRVATGNFLFNTITILLVFIFLKPVNYFITGVIGVTDNLTALALFQTLINLISVLLFYPLLNLFSNFLDRRFRDEEHITQYIHKVTPADAELSGLALEKEARRFIEHVIFYCRKIFEDTHTLKENGNKKFSDKTAPEQYEYIKHLHGDIYAYYLSLQNGNRTEEESKKIDTLISSVRNGMYAAKSLKDITHDIEQLRNSSNEVKFNIYLKARLSCLEFCGKILSIPGSDKPRHFEELVSIYKYIQEQYDASLRLLYKEAGLANLSEIEVSTIINFNRELYTFYKSIIFSVKNLLLTPGDPEYFDGLPGFIN